MAEDVGTGDFSEDDQSASISSKLNWLRAGVLGANDGIVSTAGMVFGVAGAASSDAAILIAGVAAVTAGALSMAVGEYISVSSQRDTEKAELAHEQMQLERNPERGLAQLTALVAARGIEQDLARRVAEQLTARDPLAAHAQFELGIQPGVLTSPVQAGLASMTAFTVGGLVPLLAMALSPHRVAIGVTAAAVVLALAVTGSISARLGRAPRLPAVIRTVAGGLLAMGATYGVGYLIAGTGLRPG